MRRVKGGLDCVGTSSSLTTFSPAESRFPTRSYGSRSRLRAALLSTTMLVAAVSVLPMRASAACVNNNSGNPDLITCQENTSDTDGASRTTFDSVTFTMESGSSLGNGAGTSLSVNMLTGGSFVFDQSFQNTAISGSGTQVGISSVLSSTQDWTIQKTKRTVQGDRDYCSTRH